MSKSIRPHLLIVDGSLAYVFFWVCMTMLLYYVTQFEPTSAQVEGYKKKAGGGGYGGGGGGGPNIHGVAKPSRMSHPGVQRNIRILYSALKDQVVVRCLKLKHPRLPKYRLGACTSGLWCACHFWRCCVFEISKFSNFRMTSTSNCGEDEARQPLNCSRRGGGGLPPFIGAHPVGQNCPTRLTP